MDLLRQKQWFDSSEFQRDFHTDVPLGVFCSPAGTHFALWAPTAQEVALHLYADGSAGGPMETLLLQRGKQGLWQLETARNLDGVYYDYEVTVDGVRRRTADPCAKACGVNGFRSMVVDLRRTDPAGWETDRAPALKGEQVIYELHIKDFSWDVSGGFDPADRGKFSALCRTGTTLNGDGIHPTGIDYLKWLGVTHIQLMPVYDYGSVDETGGDNQYNWGYDPVNYNVPEGSYASDPYHGEVRIRELKEAVASLHRHGFRVIMDVVYNHTYQLDSWLWRTVPWYYYRQNADGTASNGSGCGNELASERSMCARYILESVLYWAQEYHIDGFRFDLMGLMDVELMNSIRSALDQQFGAGQKLVYGEPWRAADSAARPGTVLCTKDNLRVLNPNIGAFCDDTRDAVKGGLMDVEAVGFVNGGGISAQRLYPCVTGWVGSAAQAPSQTITYLSCHDDWTLWDKLVYTMDPERHFAGNQPHILRANRLAAAINLCCQGRPFIHAGEEFARTKGGVKNSYRSSPAINRLDWHRASENRELVDYYRGLIALRQQLPALQDKTADAAKRVVMAMDLAPDCAGICFENSGSPWEKLLLIVNASFEPRRITLPEGNWQILADHESAFRWQADGTVATATQLPPISALILGSI